MVTTPSSKMHSTVLSFILIIVLCAFFSTSCVSRGEYVPPTPRANLLKETNIKLNSGYVFDRCRSLQAKPFDNNTRKKKLMIIGDSQGCDFLNSMVENGYLKNYQVQFRFIPYACQNVPYENINHYISAKHKNFCLKTDRLDTLKKIKQQAKAADVVVFSALWKPTVADKLPKIFHYLGITKQQRLVVIGYRFFGKINISKYANLSNHERRLARIDIGRKSLKINALLKKRLAKNVVFVNPHELVCGTTTSCPLFTSDFRLISYDGRHLTKAGARYMGRILFNKSPLKLL